MKSKTQLSQELYKKGKAVLLLRYRHVNVSLLFLIMYILRINVWRFHSIEAELLQFSEFYENHN